MIDLDFSVERNLFQGRADMSEDIDMVPGESSESSSKSTSCKN